MSHYKYTFKSVFSWKSVIRIKIFFKKYYENNLQIVFVSAKRSKITFIHQVVNYTMCWYILFYVLPNITVNNLLVLASLEKLNSIGLLALGLFINLFVGNIVPTINKIVSGAFKYIFSSDLIINQM